MADDILQIFSNFDGRLRNKLHESLESDAYLSRAVTRLDQALKSLDRQMSRYITIDRPIWSDSADAVAFLDSVDELVNLIREWTPLAADKGVTVCLDRAEDLLQQVMFRLEEEFKLLMDSFDDLANDLSSVENGTDNDVEEGEGEKEEIPVANVVSDYNVIIDALPAGVINDLHEISKRMVGADDRYWSRVFEAIT